jgi:NTE family protein
MLVVLAIVVRPRNADAGCDPIASGLDASAALIFSGGGAKGAWEAGVATALVRGGVPIRVAAGSSAGALNAVMLADGRLDQLEATWRTITREHVYRLRPSVVLSGLLPGWLTVWSLGSASSLLDPAPLRELIASRIDFARLRASEVRAVVVATDLVRRETRAFDNAAITPDVLLAATALPGVFPPVTVDGQSLVDGGLTGRAPVVEALRSDPTLRRAIVLVSYASEERGRPPRSVRHAVEEAFETAMAHQIRRDTELVRLRHPGVDVVAVTPSRPIELRPLDFDAARTSEAFDRGHGDGAACLESWRKSTAR